MPRLVASEAGVVANPYRFRLSRAGVLNVWQYDAQVFDFAEGRLLLRGANGAGKSKTLEMLLPFALDGDKRNLTASAQHHTSLLWLMLENGAYDGQSRIGYVWVEFVRRDAAGAREVLTCGVGIRASQSSKSAVAWYFTCPRAVGDGLELADAAGPLTPERCREAVEPDGHYFDPRGGRAYKEHVGRILFGLEPLQYDELLRMLYWLRRPQVGEDIAPDRLAETLAVSLPQLNEAAVRSAGDSLDQLADFGEQIDRLTRSAEALEAFCRTYRRYATGEVARRARGLLEAHREQLSLSRDAAARERDLAEIDDRLKTAEAGYRDAEQRLSQARAAERQLMDSPEARSQRVLLEKEKLAAELRKAAADGERAATAAAGAARADEQALADDAGQLASELRSVHGSAQRLAAELVSLRVGASLAVPAFGAQPATVADCTRLEELVSGHASSAEAARPAVGQARSAVRVVTGALDASEQAERERHQADQRLTEAERALEEADRRLQDATATARAAEAGWVESVAAWQADPRAVAVSVPEEVDAGVLRTLPSRVRAETKPVFDELYGREAAARASEHAAQSQLSDLRQRRSEIERETDPAPAPPPLGRTPRDLATGTPLWLLVDFVPGMTAEAAAAVEAALQASGLLDAWVRADGAVLDATDLDAVLPLGPPTSADRSLADVLTPTPPDGSPVADDVIFSVLRRVTVVDMGAAAATGAAVVGLDGSWQLGPILGRATKPAAQYIGTSARAAERARRLDEIDKRLAEVAAVLGEARQARETAAGRIAALARWMEELPSGQDVLLAWDRLEDRTEQRDTLAGAAAEASAHAHETRRRAAQARQRLIDLAALHDVPTDRPGLSARDERLRDLDRDLAAHLDHCHRVKGPLRRWARDRARVDTKLAEAAVLRERVDAALRRAQEATAECETLREMVGAAVEELERRLAEVQDTLATARGDQEAADRERTTRREQRGRAEGDAVAARRRAEEYAPTVAEAVAHLAAVAGVEGLLRAALDREPDEAEAVGLAAADGVKAGGPVPRAALDLARTLDRLPVDREVSQAQIYGEWRDLSAGYAAATEPRVVAQHGALAVVGRDDTGEYPIMVLAERMTAKLQADRSLFTEREGRIFTEHLLGDLGEELRARQQEAAELVAAMNRLLDGVQTSQGIQVRLAWRLRDDSGPEVKQAVELLAKPLGALLPDERQQLRQALHQLIEASRAEHPEADYTEHLNHALDYRRWSRFEIRIRRPGEDWQRLTRRTPLSQGEQKVVCYLPLFAAAAAHFTSVAGAAPYAPRFVLLDDAFPKIDVKTHPKLFGLLVAFDLDFVVTSERLWGDYPTVPKLAIYEALRSPAERGIAQYKHLWDGHRLQAVDA